MPQILAMVKPMDVNLREGSAGEAAVGSADAAGDAEAPSAALEGKAQLLTAQPLVHLHDLGCPEDDNSSFRRRLMFHSVRLFQRDFGCYDSNRSVLSLTKPKVHVSVSEGGYRASSWRRRRRASWRYWSGRLGSWLSSMSASTCQYKSASSRQWRCKQVKFE